MRLYRRWTLDEMEILKASAGVETFKAIGSRLDRSPQSCQAKAWSLKLKGCRLGGTPKRRFADHDLIGNAGRYALTEVAKMLNVDPTTVTRHARRLKLQGRRRGHRYAGVTAYYGDIVIRWTPEEMARLREVKAGRIEKPTYLGHEWLTGRNHE